MGSARFDLERLLWRLRSFPNTYVVGAGASYPVVPFGVELQNEVIRLFLRRGSFPTEYPPETLRTTEIRRSFRSVSSGYDPIVDRYVLPGDEDLVPELLRLMSDASAQMWILHILGRARHWRRQLDSVRVFRAFHPGLILAFNVDGLLADLHVTQHRIVDVHETIPAYVGGPGGAELAEAIHEFALAPPSFGVNFDAPERVDDLRLRCKLSALRTFVPTSILVIGYTFARKADGHNDWVSLAEFVGRYRNFGGEVYVVDPEPGPLAETLSANLSAAEVIPMPLHWNVLARAFIDGCTDGGGERSLRYQYERMLDAYGPSGPN